MSRHQFVVTISRVDDRPIDPFIIQTLLRGAARSQVNDLDPVIVTYVNELWPYDKKFDVAAHDQDGILLKMYRGVLLFELIGVTAALHLDYPAAEISNREHEPE